MTIQAPVFPPLMQGEEVEADPLAHAVGRAREGVDAGLIAWRWDDFALAAALVLAPEEPLVSALGAFLAVTNGLGDALAVLGPPKLPMHLEWPGTFRINGARCGRMRLAADRVAADAVPGWMVTGFEMPFRRATTLEAGATPEDTALFEEGCGDVEPLALLEGFARHSLHWLARREDAGMARVHEEWMGRAWNRGGEIAVAGRSGRFIGLDENGGLLLSCEGATRLVPLTAILEEA